MENIKEKPIDKINSLDELIYFYESIPEEKWTTGAFKTPDGKCCSIGHLGYEKFADTYENEKLMNLIPYEKYSCLSMPSPQLIQVNDGDNGFIKYGSTPKERVLNYLKEIKKNKKTK